MGINISLSLLILIIVDPGPLATSLWLDEELESSLYLDGIVAVVDAKYFLRVRFLIRISFYYVTPNLNL
jgi:hypothetical protein